MKEVAMSAAFFALAGALIGVLGTVLADMLREKRAVRRRNQEQLRSICSDFTSHIGRTRRHIFSLKNKPQDKEIGALVETSFTEARAELERLLITSESIETQEAARYVIHLTYWLIQVTHRGLTGYDECATELDEWLSKLYREVRSELGLKHAANVYQKRLDTPPDSVKVTSVPDNSSPDA
jgi:hypothetical protein